MKTLFPLMLTTLLIGCVSVNQSAICDGTRATRDMHADALILDAGAQSLVTGATLLSQLDAACSDL